MRVGAPGAVTVIVPVREDDLVSVLAVALILNDPFPVRFVGLKFETVNQLTLLVTVQVLLDVTLTVVLPEAEPGLHVLVDKLRVPATVAAAA